MSTLEDLKRKIDTGTERARVAPDADVMKEIRAEREKPVKRFWEAEQEAQTNKTPMRRRFPNINRRKFLFWFFIATSSIIAVSAGVIYYTLFFASSDVNLDIASSGSVDAGESELWKVVVRNNSAVSFQDAEISFSYPADSIPVSDDAAVKRSLRSRVSLPILNPGEEREFDFRALIFGKEGESKKAEATFVYRPENISTRLVKLADFESIIQKVPLLVSIDAPDVVSNNQRLDSIVEISSNGSSAFANSFLRISFPSQFSFLGADPAPFFENNIWQLGDVQPGQSIKIKISGTVSGLPEETGAFKMEIGNYNSDTREFVPYAQGVKEVKIASPFLLVRQDMNGSRDGTVLPGDTVSIRLSYKNNLSRSIRGVFLTETFPENLFDLATLRVKDGAYDAQNHMIVWDAGTSGDLTELAPGQEGTVDFSAQVKKNIAGIDFSKKNFIIDARAAIDVRVLPRDLEGTSLHYEDLLSIKISSVLKLFSRAFYYNSVIPNSGPLSPQVGKTTSYTIHWQVQTGTNDVNDVSVSGVLPANVQWAGVVQGDNQDKVSYNPSSNTVTWSLGTLAANTGIARSRAGVMFQVVLNPGPETAGQAPVLMRQTQINGTDSFTSQSLSDTAPDLTTELKDDPQSKNTEWKVAP
ncbi:hypothetical protein KGQ34_00515 [Patescibacteria group bacterium]|nr:hypothetical protein [Patescibacteria group bacterium]